MLKILVAEPESCHKDYLALLKNIGKVVCQKMNKQELLKKIGDYDILIVGVETVVDRQLLDKAKKLKIIGSHTTGIDHIDIDYARQKSIKVVTLRDVSKQRLKHITATAEHTMALILSLIRKIPWAFNAVKEGKWERHHFFGCELKGKTIGIIGYGRIGSKVGEYASSFGIKVLVYDPYVNIKELKEAKVTPVDFDTLLRESDIITVHVKLTEETKNLISYKEFKKMKKKPIFINTSRGRVVDETALLEALKKRWISGAAIDVLSNETTSTNPVLNNDLVKYAQKNNNLLITPHLGGATYESMRTTGLYVGMKIKEIVKKWNL